MNFFVVLDNAIVILMKAAVTLLGAFVAFAMVIGIASRAVLDTPFFGLEELVLMAAMWLYMLGAALASRDRSHLSADFIQAFSKNEMLNNVTRLIATTISLIIAALFVTWSYSLFAWGFEKGQVTPVFRIPHYFSQGSLFVASILLLIYTLRDFINDTRLLFHKS
mgnify:FL=1